MEVTNKNFKEVLALVEEVVEGADLVAVDAEFTGLRSHANRYNDLDTAAERYEKAKNAAKEFGMIQFGLTTFRYVEKDKTYKHATFCFYTLGKTSDILSYDNSSLRFLANNGFDFNKLYKEGLPYMTIKEEEEKMAEISSQVADTPLPSPVKVAESNAQIFVAEMEAKISAFARDGEQDVYTIPGATLTGFFRKLVYNNIAAQYPNYVIRQVCNDDRDIEVRKFSSPERRRAFLEDDKRKSLHEQVGLTHVVRKVIESGKPIVGHNLMLDLFHLVHKTIQPLPDHLDQFKTLVRANLPTVYDTKLLAKDPPFCTDIPISSLGNVYKTMCECYDPPPFEVEEGCSSHALQDDSMAHNAGYDAFMTGVSFITMLKKLEGSNWTKKSLIHSKYLNKYANRLNNMHTYDVPYLNITGPDVTVDRSHIFSVECPQSWTPSHVQGLFHMIKFIKIVWVDSSHLYVIPTEAIDANTLKEHLKVIQASSPPLVRVKMYDERTSAKRKSTSGEDNPSPARPKEIKRLKSVGSDQLSKMSLNSPQEESPSVNSANSDKKRRGREGGDGVFHVPEDW